jgi:lysophospholipase L1-like esterase
LNVLRAQIDAYNQEIISLADQYGLALVRADQFYAKLTDGFAYNGINMSAKFVSGGAYSLDGLQLNPKGNALLANEYIKAINTTYHARIPQLNAVELNGAIFP